MSGAGGLVFGVAGLLVSDRVAAAPGDPMRLPYTVVLAGLGCALGLGIGFSNMFIGVAPGQPITDFFQQWRDLKISADVLLGVSAHPAV